MRHRLDFTIHERPVYVCNERFWGNLEPSEGLIWYVLPSSTQNNQYLDQNGEWQESDTFDPMPGFATQEEAEAFAEQFRDGRIIHQYGTKMPFQILGRDVWVCSGRLNLPGAIDGVSGDYYIADVPEGQNGNMLSSTGVGNASPYWREMDLQTMRGGFVTFPTAQDAMDRACKLAGVDPVHPTESSAPPVLNLEFLLGKTLNALIRLPSPPPDIRGLVLAKTSLWVPEDVTDIAGWLIDNWKPGAKAVAAAKPKTRYSINVSYSEQQSGRCYFTQTAEYVGEVEYDNERLAELLDGADSIEAMRSRLIEDIEESAELDEQDTNVEDYSDYEVNDSNGREWNIRTSDVQAIIEQFLEDNPEFDPDYEEENDEDYEEYTEEEEEEDEIPL